MRLHHCAYKIQPGSSKILQKFSEYLGAKLIWEGEDQGREIALQFDNGFCIQFSEIKEESTKSENKKETHLAFSSENPVSDINILKEWFEKKGVKTRIGEWSEKELWIDCPEIFTNFVIEILDTR